jgi:hypothetical protein
MRFPLILATLACSAAAFAQNLPDPPFPDTIQMAYVSNLNQGDADLNITNGGSLGAFLGLNNSNGDICANIYVFDPAQEMLACCSCRVTPDALNTFSVKNDLISHTLTPAVPTSIIIKLVASSTISFGNTCTNSAANLLSQRGAPGMRAWATTLHQNPSGGYSVTENAFQDVTSSAVEISSLSQMCGFVVAEGSGNFGFCNAACALTSNSGVVNDGGNE